MNNKKGLELTSIFVADDVRIEINRKLIVIGMFDSISSDEIPTKADRFFVVADYNFGSGEINHKIEIKNEKSGELVISKDFPLLFTNEEFSAKCIVKFTNIVFEQEGLYSINSLVDDKLYGSAYLEVFKIEESVES